MGPEPGPFPGRRLGNGPGFALLGGLCLALAAALACVLLRPEPRSDSIAEALRDPETRAEVVRELLQGAQAVWDSFPDPDVGRVLLPGLEGQRSGGVAVHSNRFGVREREYAVPKPAGTVRLVLLGDSFVFGNGVAAEDRCGAFLEASVRERLEAGAPTFECLHVGMTDWNVVAEAAFLRRQLSGLQPDLVVHVLFHNDLDDASGTRGMGTLAGFSPQRRERADSLLTRRTPFELGFSGGVSFLAAGLDHESRGRYAEARGAILELAAAVERSGGQYLALLHWPRFTGVAHRELLAPLREEQRAYLPRELFEDPAWTVSEGDRHWNRAAAEYLGQLLYGLVQRRGLLPGLSLAPWPEADRAVAASPRRSPASSSTRTSIPSL